MPTSARYVKHMESTVSHFKATGGPRFMRISEAAAILRLSGSMVRKLCRSGKLASVRLGSQWRVPESEVVRLMQQAERNRRA